MTSTWIVHTLPEPAGRVALLRVTELEVVPTLPLPQLLWEALAGLAMVTPPGRLSVRNIFVNALGSLLVMMMVIRLLSPAQMVLGMKVLLTPGGVIVRTSRVALAGVVLAASSPEPAPVPVAVEAPAPMVLIRLPGVIELTFTTRTQEPLVPDLAGTVPPLTAMVVPPGLAVTLL